MEAIPDARPGEMERFKKTPADLMVNVLSNIVEFRNGESGLHVFCIRALTELLLEHLLHTPNPYDLKPEDVEIIGLASVLHDIGKIAISNEILNKAGRLTPAEYSVMKDHAAIGANMLQEVPVDQSDPLILAARDICRWHHERYDGGGYPDGLKGDAIPISAQVVGLADVYDALTRDRVYKKAYDHATAARMILNGECGSFNPLLLDAISQLADRLPEELAARVSQYT